MMPSTKSKLQRLPAGPELAGEQVVASACDPRAPAFLHERDEVLVDDLLNFLEPRHLVGVFRLERVELELVLASGIDAALDPDLADEVREAEARRHDADRAHQRGPIRVDSRRRRRPACSRPMPRHPRRRRRPCAISRRERPDALVDEPRLHGRTAWRVDLECNRRRILDGKGALDGACACRDGQPLPQGRGRADAAAKADHRDYRAFGMERIDRLPKRAKPEAF